MRMPILPPEHPMWYEGLHIDHMEQLEVPMSKKVVSKRYRQKWNTTLHAIWSLWAGLCGVDTDPCPQGELGSKPGGTSRCFPPSYSRGMVSRRSGNTRSGNTGTSARSLAIEEAKHPPGNEGHRHDARRATIIRRFRFRLCLAVEGSGTNLRIWGPAVALRMGGLAGYNPPTLACQPSAFSEDRAAREPCGDRAELAVPFVPSRFLLLASR